MMRSKEKKEIFDDTKNTPNITQSSKNQLKRIKKDLKNGVKCDIIRV